MMPYINKQKSKDEQVLRLVKEMTAHPEAFSEQEKEKINRMDIALQTATDILENLMTPDTQMTIVLRQGRIRVDLTKA